MLKEARRASPTVTADWVSVKALPIKGVEIKEIRNVVIRSGILTECFRPEWFARSFQAAHVVYMSLLPGGISSWHCHGQQSDVIIPVSGQLRIGLYDDRLESETYQSFHLLNVSVARPAAVLVPPHVWHAIKNPSGEGASYIVVNDQVFNYAEPDDWILPPGSSAIPFSLD